MKPVQAERWAEIRKKGQWSYIWRVGILTYGLLMCAIFVGMDIFRQPGQFLQSLVGNVRLWTCAGAVFGFLTWHGTEWQYRRHVRKQSDS